MLRWAACSLARPPSSSRSCCSGRVGVDWSHAAHAVSGPGNRGSHTHPRRISSGSPPAIGHVGGGQRARDARHLWGSCCPGLPALAWPGLSSRRRRRRRRRRGDGVGEDGMGLHGMGWMAWAGLGRMSLAVAQRSPPRPSSTARQVRYSAGRFFIGPACQAYNLGTAGWEGCRGLASPEAPSAIEDGKRPRRSSSKVARPRLRMSAYQHQRRALRSRPSQGQPTGTAHGLSVQVRVIPAGRLAYRHDVGSAAVRGPVCACPPTANRPKAQRRWSALQRANCAPARLPAGHATPCHATHGCYEASPCRGPTRGHWTAALVECSGSPSNDFHQPAGRGVDRPKSRRKTPGRVTGRLWKSSQPPPPPMEGKAPAGPIVWVLWAR